MRFVDRSLDAVAAPKVLDVGCGLGDFTRALAGRYPKAEVVGVDFSPQTISLAQAGPPPSVQYVCGELTALPVSDGWAHLTTCINTLHHVEASEQRRALEDLARVTTHHLVIEIKNANSLYFKRHSKSVEGVPIAPTTSRAVEGVLAEQGFQLQHTWRFFGASVLSPLEVLWFRMG
jgi:ubiquinone/menaquinone biosynthesis C-methylase UbiE